MALLEVTHPDPDICLGGTRPSPYPAMVGGWAI